MVLNFKIIGKIFLLFLTKIAIQKFINQSYIKKKKIKYIYISYKLIHIFINTLYLYIEYILFLF